MLKSLKNRRNRKGFTLAELLIVVAIIAVLVAIAVPLFVGALDKAKEDVFNANARAIKSVAVYEILSDKNQYEKGRTSKKWLATGTVNNTGDITLSKIEDGSSGSATEYDSWKEGDEIKVLIQEIDLNSLT